MYVTLNNIQDNKGSRYKSKRIGRGIGSGKGKTAGKGYKGQKARSGVAIYGFEGGQMPIHRRLPKRGFVNTFRKDIQIINLEKIAQFIDKGLINNSQIITKDILLELSFIKNIKSKIKLLSKGNFEYKISIQADHYSSKANQVITSLGGNIINKVV